MDAHVDFDLNAAIARFTKEPKGVDTPEAPSELVACENDPEALTPELVTEIVDSVIDSITGSPEAITRGDVFDTLQFLLKCVPVLEDEQVQSDGKQTDRAAPLAELFVQARTTPHLPHATLGTILDLLTSALSTEADATHGDLEADEAATIPVHKQVLEMYAFLLRWIISAVIVRSRDADAAPVKAKAKGKGAKAKAGSKNEVWDPLAQLEKAFEVVSKVLRVRLARVFVTSVERETFIYQCTKPVYDVLGYVEAMAKKTSAKQHCFKVLCIAVKQHGHAHVAMSEIDNGLKFWEHLAEPMAEFLHVLAEQWDYPQLTGEFLKMLSSRLKEQDLSKDPKGSKSVSTFLTKLSELMPHLVEQQVDTLEHVFGNGSYTVRCAMIEVCGNLIVSLIKRNETEPSEMTAKHIQNQFDKLEERFLDVNPYCRSQVMKVYARLCDLDQQDQREAETWARLPPAEQERLWKERGRAEQRFTKEQRQTAAEKASSSLLDKSSHVRRHAIRLLNKLVSTHPFTDNQSLLKSQLWADNLSEIEAQIKALEPPEEQGKPGSDDHTVDSTLFQEATQVEQPSPEKPKHPDEMTDEEKLEIMKKMQQIQEQAQTLEKLEKLELERNYLELALTFANTIDESAEIVTQLLSSKSKSEVIDAMDFFKTIFAYKVETANVGVRRMLRLIWTKGNSDEGKAVQTHLIECYKELFFNAPAWMIDQNGNPDHYERAKFIARNMATLTYGTSPAELTSLEQLLSTMMKEGLINDLVVQTLWRIYSHRKPKSRSQRRGAIIVLGMLALADPDIIIQHMEDCLTIGLGAPGRQDLALARYTCIALRRMSPPPSRQSAGAAAPEVVKLDNDNQVLLRLAAMVEMVSDSKEWFGVAEQAIGAIYILSRHPDVLCSQVLRRKAKYVFANQGKQRPTSSGSMSAKQGRSSSPAAEKADDEDVVMEDAPVEIIEQPRSQNPALALSQLLFIVGHVAIKQIVHLELCEQECRRRKEEKDRLKAEKDNAEQAAAAEAPKGKKKSSRKSGTAPAEPDQMELTAGSTEDEFYEQLAAIREHELLYGERSILSNFGPLVHDICANNTTYNHPILQEQAALCLAKLMCVSSKFCEDNLQLLITILERSKDPVVRSNLVIALSDMAVCFNHLIDENTDYLYRRLNDSDPSVKRTCLMTLTFLILAGQVKVKGQLGEMAKCLEDEDKRIADMARMFFSELATKDNAVYNQFIDMFSLLSSDRGLPEDGFKRIIKFIAGFIEKDKHHKQLASKLAARLSKAETKRQWDDAAYALAQLKNKDEEITKVIAEGFKVVQTEA